VYHSSADAKAADSPFNARRCQGLRREWQGGPDPRIVQLWVGVLFSHVNVAGTQCPPSTTPWPLRIHCGRSSDGCGSGPSCANTWPRSRMSIQPPQTGHFMKCSASSFGSPPTRRPIYLPRGIDLVIANLPRPRRLRVLGLSSLDAVETEQ
jgi:hypothetical protein